MQTAGLRDRIIKAATPKRLAVLKGYLFGVPATTLAHDLAVSERSVKSRVFCMYRAAGVTTREGMLEALESTGLLAEWGWLDGIAEVR